MIKPNRVNMANNKGIIYIIMMDDYEILDPEYQKMLNEVYWSNEEETEIILLDLFSDEEDEGFYEMSES